MDALPPAATSTEVRTRLLRTLRRDLIGPGVGADDADLARELLAERPSRWYLTGFIAPEEGNAMPQGDRVAEQGLLDDAMEAEGEPPPDPVLGGTAEDNTEPDPGVGSRRMQPTSLGLTVLLRPDVREIEAVVTWGDYQTEPPLPPQVLTEETAQRPPEVQWRRLPRTVFIRLAVPEDGRAATAASVPDSAAPQLPGGGLVLHCHGRSYDVRQPDGSVERVRALTVALVNRRRRPGPASWTWPAPSRSAWSCAARTVSCRAATCPGTGATISTAGRPTCTTATSPSSPWAAPAAPVGPAMRTTACARRGPTRCPPPR